MAFYSLKNWKNRDVEFPGRRTLTDVLSGTSQTVDVTRSEGTITEAGDAFDASTMNDLEGRISSAFLLVDGAKFDEPTNSPSEGNVVKYSSGSVVWAAESGGGGDLQESDITWKESGSRLVSGGSVRVNPWELFSGTVGTRTGKNLGELSETTKDNYQNGNYSFENGGFTWEVTGNYSRIGFAFDVTVGETYTISFRGFSDANYRRVNFNDTVSWSQFSYGVLTLTNEDVSYTKTITATSNILFIGFYFSAESSTGSATITNFQLEKGSSATPYEPYFEPYKVITGFIPSARFFQMGRKYFDELPVKNPSESLNTYYKGAAFNSYGNLTSSEEVDNIRVNAISSQYGYEGGAFLTSVSGVIYTDNGNIPVDFTVSDLWGYGANGESELPESGQPVSNYNRFATNSNGFPIELNPVNQASISGLTIGSPVQFRITGTLFFILENVGLKDSGSNSEFYELTTWTDNRDGMHYSNHFPTMSTNDTLLLSSITTAINFKFKSVDIDPGDESDISATVAADGSDVTITSTAATGDYIITIHHESDDHPDTTEQIKITVS